MQTIDRLTRAVRVLAPLDAQRVAAAVPAGDRQRIGKAVEDLRRWSTDFLSAISRSAAAGGTCPRCDGEGCPMCQPGARR